MPLPSRLTVLVLMAATLAGCTFLAPTPNDAPPADAEVGDDARLRVEARFLELNATPGHRVSLPVRLACDEPPAPRVLVRLAGAGALQGPDEDVALGEGCEAVAFLALDVPGGTDVGARPLAVEVRDAATGELLRRAANETTLHVLAPLPGFTANSTARVAYTARVADTGEVFFTNEPAVRGLAYARSPEHRDAANPLTVEGRAAAVPEGFLEAMIGMQPGEQRSVLVPPEKAYGRAQLLAREPREESIPRDQLVEVVPEAMAWDTFADHIRATGQGDPTTYAEGDVFVVADGTNAWRYEITGITRERVDYEFRPGVRDRYTLYPFWPNASVVMAVAEHSVAFYTTPTTEIGEPFTMRAGWPGMSTLVRVDNATAVVRHSPPEGLEYERPTRTGELQRVVVANVTEEHVVVEYPNPHPLAGRALEFDVRLLALERR